LDTWEPTKYKSKLNELELFLGHIQ
jgi:hypothetical protein